MYIVHITRCPNCLIETVWDIFLAEGIGWPFGTSERKLIQSITLKFRWTLHYFDCDVWRYWGKLVCKKWWIFYAKIVMLHHIGDLIWLSVPYWEPRHSKMHCAILKMQNVIKFLFRPHGKEIFSKAWRIRNRPYYKCYVVIKIMVI